MLDDFRCKFNGDNSEINALSVHFCLNNFTLLIRIVVFVIFSGKLMSCLFILITING